MKKFASDVKEFSNLVKGLLSTPPSGTNGAFVTFQDYRLTLLSYSSEQVADLLSYVPHLSKTGQVLLVQQDDPYKALRADVDCLNDESMEGTEDSFTNGQTNGHGEEGSLCGALTVNEARYLLSLYNICINPSQTSVSAGDVSIPDMLVCCDGKDSNHVGLMGCRSIPRTKASEVKGQRLPNVAAVSVSCFGPVTSKSSLMSVHQVIQQSVGQAHRDSAATTAFAQYEIVGMAYHEASVLEPTAATHFTSVTMDCSWEHVKSMLEIPHSAQCNVHVCAVPGDMRSAAYSVYKELATLVGFAEGLKTEELEWNPKESSAESVEEAVSRLIEKDKQGLQRQPEPQVQTPLDSPDTDFDSLLCGYVIPERQDLYFSECLWNILWSQATCYDDVITAFSMVFQELVKGELQPIVHSDNRSTLAEVIRASYQEQMHTIDPDRVAKLTMLVEIGLDKLRRDFTKYFIASELTTLNQLSWFLESGQACSLSQQVTRLRALHNVLELSVAAVTSLKLPLKHRRALVRSALSYYQSHPQEDIHTFSLPVEAAAVERLYTSFQPSLWRLTVKGSTGTHSSYQLSVKPPLSHIHGMDSDTSVGDLTNASTFSYHVTHSKETLLPFL